MKKENDSQILNDRICPKCGTKVLWTQSLCLNCKNIVPYDSFRVKNKFAHFIPDSIQVLRVGIQVLLTISLILSSILSAALLIYLIINICLKTLPIKTLWLIALVIGLYIITFLVIKYEKKHSYRAFFSVFDIIITILFGSFLFGICCAILMIIDKRYLEGKTFYIEKKKRFNSLLFFAQYY